MAYPSLLPFLEETIAHENKHAARFLALMKARAIRPCGAMFLWGLGGTVLGYFTSFLGRNGVMICTEAVERTVHDHLNEQIAWLGSRDVELVKTITEIRDEEMGHLEGAQQKRSCYSFAARSLDKFVVLLTSTIIWLSTYGASTHTRQAVAQP